MDIFRNKTGKKRVNEFGLTWFAVLASFQSVSIKNSCLGVQEKNKLNLDLKKETKY